MRYWWDSSEMVPEAVSVRLERARRHNFNLLVPIPNQCSFVFLPAWLLGPDEQKLLEAAMAYVSGNPIMTDDEFDQLKLRLKVCSCYPPVNLLLECDDDVICYIRRMEQQGRPEKITNNQQYSGRSIPREYNGTFTPAATLKKRKRESRVLDFNRAKAKSTNLNHPRQLVTG